jgi:hypothetical protein
MRKPSRLFEQEFDGRASLAAGRYGITTWCDFLEADFWSRLSRNYRVLGRDNKGEPATIGGWRMGA